MSLATSRQTPRDVVFRTNKTRKFCRNLPWDEVCNIELTKLTASEVLETKQHDICTKHVFPLVLPRAHERNFPVIFISFRHT